MQLAEVNTEILARSVHSKQHVLLQMQYKFFFSIFIRPRTIYLERRKRTIRKRQTVTC